MHELERDAKKNIDAVCELEREGEIVRERRRRRSWSHCYCTLMVRDRGAMLSCPGCCKVTNHDDVHLSLITAHM